jgi:hypothetical protein
VRPDDDGAVPVQERESCVGMLHGRRVGGRQSDALRLHEGREKCGLPHTQVTQRPSWARFMSRELPRNPQYLQYLRYLAFENGARRRPLKASHVGHQALGVVEGFDVVEQRGA